MKPTFPVRPAVAGVSAAAPAPTAHPSADPSLGAARRTPDATPFASRYRASRARGQAAASRPRWRCRSRICRLVIGWFAPYSPLNTPTPTPGGCFLYYGIVKVGTTQWEGLVQPEKQPGQYRQLGRRRAGADVVADEACRLFEIVVDRCRRNTNLMGYFFG